MKRFALIVLLAAAPALAGESLEKTTVKFGNGAVYDFVPFDLLPNGTSRFHVANNGTNVTVETFDGESLADDKPQGEIACFDLFYDAKTDLLQCTQRNGYQGWYTNFYHGLGGALSLRKVVRLDLDDPETPANEEKTVTVYEAK